MEQVKNQRAWEKLPEVKSSLQDFATMVADAKNRIIPLQRLGKNNWNFTKRFFVLFYFGTR